MIYLVILPYEREVLEADDRQGLQQLFLWTWSVEDYLSDAVTNGLHPVQHTVPLTQPEPASNMKLS